MRKFILFFTAIGLLGMTITGMANGITYIFSDQRYYKNPIKLDVFFMKGGLICYNHLFEAKGKEHIPNFQINLGSSGSSCQDGLNRFQTTLTIPYYSINVIDPVKQNCTYVTELSDGRDLSRPNVITAAINCP